MGEKENPHDIYHFLSKIIIWLLKKSVFTTHTVNKAHKKECTSARALNGSEEEEAPDEEEDDREGDDFLAFFAGAGSRSWSSSLESSNSVSSLYYDTQV